MPYRRLATAVLADWLEVEHTLRVVQEGTREAVLLRVEAEGLRAEYQRLVDQAMLFKHPVPPPFPTCTGAASTEIGALSTEMGVSPTEMGISSTEFEPA